MPASPPSVLFVATLLGGEGPTGVETHLHQILGEARARGHPASLVTPYTGSRLARAPFRPLKHLNSEYAKIAYRFAQGSSVRRQLRALLDRHPGAPVTIYAQCPLSARAAVGARRGSGAVVAAAVHYNGSEAEEMVARGAARPDGPAASHLLRLERGSLPRVDRIAFVSEFMRRVVNRRVPAIAAVPQATLANFAEIPASAADPSPPERDLIAVGTLEPRKNQAFLLRMLAECRRLGREYSLTIAGDGPDLGALQRLSGELGLAAQVQFLGFHPGAAELIPRHRVLVHAATAENCPLVIAEALACGRPILAPAIGGIPELFRDGVEGRYWNLESPANAAADLIGLLDDEAAYARMAAAARRRYEASFSGLKSRWMDFLLRR